jgi:hypothetical protein
VSALGFVALSRARPHMSECCCACRENDRLVKRLWVPAPPPLKHLRSQRALKQVLLADWLTQKLITVTMKASDRIAEILEERAIDERLL